MTASFTDLESLIREWGDRGSGAVLLHVGYASLSVDEVDGLLEGRDDQALFTAAAKYVLPLPFRAAETVVAHIGGHPVHPGFTVEAPDVQAAVQDDASRSSPATTITGFPEPNMLPEWLLSSSVRALMLPVRSQNALERANFTTVREIVALGQEGVLNTRNFGVTGLHQLVSRLSELLREGPPATAAIRRSVHGTGEAAGTGTSADAASTPQARVSESVVQASEPCAGTGDKPLMDMLDEALNALDDRRRLIMSSRMGCIGKVATLEEIGQLLAVSRERIRQIESKIIAQWRGSLGRSITDHIATCVNIDRTVVSVEDIEVIDVWFRGIASQKSAFKYLLDAVCDPPWYILTIEACDYVARCSPARWRDLMRAARRVVDAAVQEESRSTRQQLLARFESIVEPQESNLSDLLWRELLPDMRFALIDGQEMLCGFGRSAEMYVTEVLEAADRPMHYSEIHESLAARGVDFNVIRVHNASQSVGLSFGAGTYGLRKHLSLTDEEVDALVRAAEEVVFEEDPLQQWHADELIQELIERGYVTGVELNSYILGIALLQSTRLRSLGRMVWVADSTSYEERREILDAVRDVIEEAGRPLSTKDVRELVRRTRRLSSSFQIHPQGDVVRVGPGLWGLRQRDVPFSDAEVEQLRDILASCLAEGGTGIHVSEIESVLRERAPWAMKDVSPHLFLGLAKGDSRLATTGRGVVYLAEWQDSRRQTASGVIRELLGDAGSRGMLLDEVHRRLEERLGRSVARPLCTSMMVAVGAQYDAVQKRWRLAAVE